MILPDWLITVLFFAPIEGLILYIAWWDWRNGP